ncbi:MAG: CvpA family protein [Planctomycetota bacterium]|nr:CvpA family protein [Planctomycetota bacterium]
MQTYTYDVIMLVILGVSVLFGFLKGFAWQVASVAAFVVSYLVAANFNESIAGYFGVNPLVSKFLLFMGTALVIWIGYGVIHKQIEQFRLKSFDRQIGAIVGLGSGILACLVVTFFAVMFGEGMGRKVVQSQSGKYIMQVIQQLDEILPDEIQSKVNPYLEKLDSELTQAQTGVEENPTPDDEAGVADAFSESLSEEEMFIRKIESVLQGEN